MRVNFYKTKIFTAIFRSHAEYMMVFFVFAIVFSILIVVGVNTGAGSLVLLAFITAVGCWVLLIAEIYHFLHGRRVD